jgi:hypothetical protein
MKITVVNTKTQSKTVIDDSQAKTLSELKDELSDHGIDWNNMDIWEGTTHTIFTSNDSILPELTTDRQKRKGLVFMLTPSSKNVGSGADKLSRSAIISAIKTNHLEEAVKRYFNGKNYTIIKTVDLAMFLEKHYAANASLTSPKKEESKPEEETACKEVSSRKEAYAAIKEYHLEDDIKDEFGDNYTHISTPDLLYFVNDFLRNNDTEEDNSCQHFDDDDSWSDDDIERMKDSDSYYQNALNKK